MGRFLDLDPSRPVGLPASLRIRVGDLLRVNASGGTVVQGQGTVRLLGAYTSAVLTTAGTVLSPEGAPNIVVLLASGPGHAVVDVVTGDPWHSPTTRRMDLLVDP